MTHSRFLSFIKKALKVYNGFLFFEQKTRRPHSGKRARLPYAFFKGFGQ